MFLDRKSAKVVHGLQHENKEHTEGGENARQVRLSGTGAACLKGGQKIRFGLDFHNA